MAENKQQHAKVLEKFYSVQDVACLLGFNERWVRERVQAGDFTLVDHASGAVIAEPIELGNQVRIPASAVNAYLAKHPYQYDAGIKARNRGELLRKVKQQEQQQSEEEKAA